MFLYFLPHSWSSLGPLCLCIHPSSKILSILSSKISIPFATEFLRLCLILSFFHLPFFLHYEISTVSCPLISFSHSPSHLFTLLPDIYTFTYVLILLYFVYFPHPNVFGFYWIARSVFLCPISTLFSFSFSNSSPGSLTWRREGNSHTRLSVRCKTHNLSWITQKLDGKRKKIGDNSTEILPVSEKQRRAWFVASVEWDLHMI